MPDPHLAAAEVAQAATPSFVCPPPPASAPHASTGGAGAAAHPPPPAFAQHAHRPELHDTWKEFERNCGPNFCPPKTQEIVNLIMLRGYSDEKAGALCGVHPAAIRRWRRKFPEFRESLAWGRQLYKRREKKRRRDPSHPSPSSPPSHPTMTTAHTSHPHQPVPDLREIPAPEPPIVIPNILDSPTLDPRVKTDLRGRPQLYSETLVFGITELIRREGCTDTTAAAFAGISGSTISRWKKERPYLKTLFNQARAEYIHDCVHLIREAKNRAGDPEWKATAWLLKTQFPDQFGPPSRRRSPEPIEDETDEPSYDCADYIAPGARTKIYAPPKSDIPAPPIETTPCPSAGPAGPPAENGTCPPPQDPITPTPPNSEPIHAVPENATPQSTSHPVPPENPALSHPLEPQPSLGNQPVFPPPLGASQEEIDLWQRSRGAHGPRSWLDDPKTTN